MRNSDIKKSIFLSGLMITLGMQLMAQSVIIRPLYGTKFIRTDPQNVTGNFDPSFRGNAETSTYDNGVNLEFMRRKYSLEIGFGRRELTLGFSTDLPDGSVGVRLFSEKNTPEINLMYNRIFAPLFPKWNQTFAVSPILSFGGNVGFNDGQKGYSDSFLKIDRFYSQVFPDRYIDYDLRDSAANKTLYSLQFKAGFNLKHKNVERFRLQFYYTLGLNNIASRTYRYYHTNDFYSGKIFTKGNEYGIVASIPIYIKRKR